MTSDWHKSFLAIATRSRHLHTVSHQHRWLQKLSRLHTTDRYAKHREKSRNQIIAFAPVATCILLVSKSSRPLACVDLDLHPHPHPPRHSLPPSLHRQSFLIHPCPSRVFASLARAQRIVTVDLGGVVQIILSVIWIDAPEGPIRVTRTQQEIASLTRASSLCPSLIPSSSPGSLSRFFLFLLFLLLSSDFHPRFDGPASDGVVD